MKCPVCWQKKKTSYEMDCMGLTLRGFEGKERVGYFCNKCRYLVLFKIEDYITFPKSEEQKDEERADEFLTGKKAT